MTGKQLSFILITIILHFLFISFHIPLTGQDETQTKIDSLTLLLATTDSIEVKKEVLVALSIQYRFDGNWEQHDQIIEEMLRLQEEYADSAYLADIYNRLGISNSLKGNTEESLKYFQKALIVNQAINHMFGVSASYENMAQVYTQIGDYTNAIDCVLNSIEIKKENNYSRIFNLYIKLASLQQLLNPEKVDHYIRLARQELQMMDSITPADQVVFYNQLGTIYKDRMMYDSSIVCSRIVVRISKEINWKSGIASGLGNLAEVFYAMGEIDSSIVYHRKSLRLSEELSECDGIAKEYLYLAKLYHELNREDSVLILANRSLKMARECGLLLEQAEALEFLANYYSSTNAFEQALSFLQNYYAIQDSISSAEVKNNIAKLEARYQSKMNEQQIELLTAENQIQDQRLQVSLLSVAILLVLILLITYAFFMRRRQSRYKENNLRQQLFLSQMNPHFIFNALGSIQNYLYKNKPDEAAGYLAKFSFLTRSILINSTEDSISLAEEIEILKSYIELEKMRLNNSFEYEIEYGQELETEFVHIPPMLIQPFIENAIKHGLREGKEQGRLLISFYDRKDILEVHIIDNGIGINQSRKKENTGHKSMALSIFTKRIQLLRKNSHNIPFPEIKDLSRTGKQGTKVELYLPIIK